MKKAVFLCSHLCSGSNKLYEFMIKHSRIDGFRKDFPNTYDSNGSILRLFTNKHKANNNSSIYLDEIFYNFQISSKSLYNTSKFIYLIRSPEQSISQIIAYNKYTPENACRYYTFRLRRICEMASQTKDAVFLTFDELYEGKGVELINDYLELSKSIEFNPDSLNVYRKNLNAVLLESTLRSQICDSYERYLYFLRNQSLRQIR